MEFFIYGHENISAKHKTTIEFTKDKEVSRKGDCILGVNADFSFSEIKRLLKKKEIEIKIGNFIVKAEVNPCFNDKKEIVIRKSEFISGRTLGINADKASIDLGRKFVKRLQDPKERIKIIIK